MNLRSLPILCCFLVMQGAAVQAASLDDVTPQLRRDAECMLRILKSTPGIDNVELEVSDIGGWPHPYLQYLAPPEPSGYRATVVFDATTNFSEGDGKSYFIAKLGGLFGLNEAGPPDYGTGKMAMLFEKKCDVHATVLFV